MLTDLRFLMEAMVARVQERGAYVAPSDATIGDVYVMFNAIADSFHGIRAAQKKWVTVVNELRDSNADDRREAQGLQRLNKRRRRTT
ncbi:hypothetical protein ACA910_000083 [Epithemia clementina (nom. ined.)]